MYIVDFAVINIKLIAEKKNSDKFLSIEKPRLLIKDIRNFKEK